MKRLAGLCLLQRLMEGNLSPPGDAGSYFTESQHFAKRESGSAMVAGTERVLSTPYANFLSSSLHPLPFREENLKRIQISGSWKVGSRDKSKGGFEEERSCNHPQLSRGTQTCHKDPRKGRASPSVSQNGTSQVRLGKMTSFWD